MQSITANAAKTKFGELLMKVQREPVQISKNGNPVAVVMSYEEYKQIESVKLEYVRSRFNQTEADIQSGNLADGEAFMQALRGTKTD